MKRAAPDLDSARPAKRARTQLLPAAGEAHVTYDAHFLPAAAATALFDELLRETPWSEERVRVFGREVRAPRSTCFYADSPAISYGYTQLRKPARAWTPRMHALRDQVAAELGGAPPNYALLNLYKDGRQYIGWHADDTTDLAPDSVVASVSLGAERDFLLRPKIPGKDVRVRLAHGSLLTMDMATQRRYEHSVPVRKRETRARINITFRRIKGPLTPPS